MGTPAPTRYSLGTHALRVAMLAVGLASATVSLASCGAGSTVGGGGAQILGTSGGSAPGSGASGSGTGSTPAPGSTATGTGTGSGSTPAPGSSASSAGDDRSCLWAVDSNEVNTLFPDTGATYWVSVLPIPPGGDVRFDGQFGHARYMSFNVYNPLLQPTDALTDYQILPATGSINPFLAGANRNATQRSYTMRMVSAVAPSPTATRPANMLYAGLSMDGVSLPQNQAVIILRVYISDKGLDPTGGVGLPNITFEYANGMTIDGSAACSLPGTTDSALPNLASIPDATSDIPIDMGAYSDVLWLKFFDTQTAEASRVYTTPAGPAVYETVGSPTSGSGGFASNADNRYISGNIDESLGNIVAIHGTFPTAPMTYSGEATMGTGDMRYWSICSNDANTLAVYACIYDEQLVRDAQGRGIVVVSMPADRPSNATASCGVTWLNWGTSDAALLIYRNMLALPQSEFPNAIQYIPGPPGQHEASVMQQFYPYANHMTSTKFESLGCPVSPDQLPSVVPSPPAS